MFYRALALKPPLQNVNLHTALKWPKRLVLIRAFLQPFPFEWIIILKRSFSIPISKFFRRAVRVKNRLLLPKLCCSPSLHLLSPFFQSAKLAKHENFLPVLLLPKFSFKRIIEKGLSSSFEIQDISSLFSRLLLKRSLVILEKSRNTIFHSGEETENLQSLLKFICYEDEEGIFPTFFVCLRDDYRMPKRRIFLTMRWRFLSESCYTVF